MERALLCLRLTSLRICPCIRAQSFGEGPQKKALSRRFKSYSWIFTDALIDKLVTLRIKEANEDMARHADGFVLLRQDGSDPAKRGRRLKDSKREKARIKCDVMREITGFSSSKGLLSKLIGSWLPQVRAADRVAGESTK